MSEKNCIDCSLEDKPIQPEFDWGKYWVLNFFVQFTRVSAIIGIISGVVFFCITPNLFTIALGSGLIFCGFVLILLATIPQILMDIESNTRNQK